MVTNMTVANTILAQLGGRRFIAMTGANSFSGDADLLTFRVPPALTPGRQVKAVRITLTPDDLYKVETLGQKPAPTHRVFVIDQADGVHVEELRSTFTRLTGLATSL